MTSKISLGLSIVLAAAVVYLFTQQGNSDPVVDRDSDTEEMTSDTESSGGVIAFIREDSILANYDFVKEEGKKLEGRMEAKSKTLNREMAAYQQEAAKWENYLAQDQSQQMLDLAISEMTKKESELERMQSDLEKMQLDYTIQLTEDVQDCVTKYAEENNIEMVVYQASMGSPILYGSEGVDITSEITDQLNIDYARAKALKAGEE